MSANDSTTPMRRCTKCQDVYPATTEYFHRDKKGKYGLTAKCKACAIKCSVQWYHDNRERAIQQRRKYYAQNKEDVLSYQKTYRLQHSEQIRERFRQYNITHAEQNRARAAQWQKDNPDRRRKNSLRWRHRNLERAREYGRRYAKDNPESMTVNARNRRARKRNAEGTHTAADEQAQFERQKGKCYYCGCKLIKTPYKPNSATVDHVVPLDRGGRNSPDNLVIACQTCNFTKQNKLPHEWAKGGRLL
jgi:5-methylcytosine-specific restriction endonuclease McrA